MRSGRPGSRLRTVGGSRAADYARKTLDEWRRLRGHTMAAALSFYALLSLAPLLLAAVAVAGLLWGDEAARGEVVDRLDGWVGPQMASVAEDIVASAAAPAGSVLALAGGLVLLLVSGSRLFIHLREALNVLFGVPDPDERGVRPWLRARVAGLGLVFLFGAVLAATVVATAVLSALVGPVGALHPAAQALVHVADAAVSLAVLTTLFAVIFRTIPQVRISRRPALVGGLATAVAYDVGKMLLGLYLGRAAPGSGSGGMGAAVLVLLWVYYSSAGFFMGAMFTKVYARGRGTPVQAQVRRRRSRSPRAAAGRAAASPRL